MQSMHVRMCGVRLRVMRVRTFRWHMWVFCGLVQEMRRLGSDVYVIITVCRNM